MSKRFNRIAWIGAGLIVLIAAGNVFGFLVVIRPWRPEGNVSSLVYQGPGGQLIYNTYANQGQTNSVNTLPDFSKCGYKGGGVPIPFVPAVVTVTNGPGDDRILIQNAINTVSELPLGANGFRGAVLLKAGSYVVSSTLFITNSGVVLRGEGSQASGGTLITLTATNQDNLIEVKGIRPSVSGSGPSLETAGTRVTITDSYVPVGAKSFTVSSAAGYHAGDRIRIQNKMNQKWIDDLGTGPYGWTTNYYQLYFERIITAVTNNTICIDAPVVQAIESLYGGGDIFKYTLPGRIENAGVESLRLESTYLNDNDEEHGWNAIYMECVENGWVRQVTARYFGYSCVSVMPYGHYITIEDCAMLDPKAQTTGGRKYSFTIYLCDFVLVQRCFTRGGRHDYVSSAVTPGPNAFVDCLATNTHADIGPHHRYSTGQIYDNIKGGEMDVQNRRTSGTGHGWSGAQILFWNCNASSIICDAPPGAMNWVIGCKGTYGTEYYPPAEPDGIWNSHGTNVLPRSLYYAQLEDRLGKAALQNVILPAQQTNTIWTQLNAWAGNGLFLNAAVAWCDESAMWPGPVNLHGIIRNLKLLDRNATSVWTKVSGPGSVRFNDASARETAAAFSQIGSYVLQFTAGDGITQASNRVSVTLSFAQPEPLLLHYEFNDADTGTTVAADTSGHGNDGVFQKVDTAAAALQTGTGVSGRAGDYAYNGTAANAMGSGVTENAGVVRYSGPGLNRPYDSITVSGWFKTDTVAIGHSARLVQADGNAGESLVLTGNSSSATLTLTIGTNNVSAPVAPYTSAGSWVFFAVTYDSTLPDGTEDVIFYAGDTNGLSVAGSGEMNPAVGAWGGLGTAADFCIGNRHGGITADKMNRPVDGYMDDIRLYGANGSSGALTAEQMEAVRRQAIQ